MLPKNHSDSDMLKYMESCWNEADTVKENRMRLDEANYDMYHMRHDFSHKNEGQSTEILSKVRMSVESTKSFFQQALADLGEWFGIEYQHDGTQPEETLPVRKHEAEKLLAFMLKQAKYFSHVGSLVQRGLLGGLMISKTHGELIPKQKYKLKKAGKGKDYSKKVLAVDDKTWQLKFDRVRGANYYPDPTGKGLYVIEEMWMDLHEVYKKARGENAIYDLEAVKRLSTATNEESYERRDKERETDQANDHTQRAHRPQVRIKEYWGDIVGEDGELLYENIVFTVANDTEVIRKPTPNPLWHQKDPYNHTPLIEVDGAVWPIALMDAATKHNHTLIEMLNLILDAAFKKVHAPSQVRVDDLVDPTQVSDGIPPGIALLVKSSLPPGAKVMEPLEATDVPNDALNVFNLLNQEYNSSALTTDLRSGVLPDRAVKATEVVEQSQTITSVFQGISKQIEENQITPELEMAWCMIAQNWDMISKDIFVSLFGEKRGTELSQIDPEDIFVSTVGGFKFKVYGISQTLARAQDFQKFTTLLQTIASSELLIEEFIQKYDMGKLLGEIMSTLDIDKHKIEIDRPAAGGIQGIGGQISPNTDMSQTPAATNTQSGLAEAFAATIPPEGFGGQQVPGGNQ